MVSTVIAKPRETAPSRAHFLWTQRRCKGTLGSCRPRCTLPGRKVVWECEALVRGGSDGSVLQSCLLQHIENLLLSHAQVLLVLLPSPPRSWFIPVTRRSCGLEEQS